MKTNTKILIGLGITAAATAALAIGVLRELKAIRNLTIEVDELAEDEVSLDELVIDEEAPVADEAAEEVVTD